MSNERPSNVSEHPARPPRTIVLCFDGTASQYKSRNTNVVKFFDLLNKDCPDQQANYYQAGIGTYFAPGVVSPLWSRVASLLDDAFAWYLDEHVMDGYNYLMETYHHGDKICLFGFSRGAYTARALAGMLNKVGLLPKDNDQQVSFAYKAYKRTDKEGIKLAAGFKKTFSRDVKVEFVGVWETVQSTGILMGKKLPFTDCNSAVRVFRHALSLDEHRCRYRPDVYHRPAHDDDEDDVSRNPSQTDNYGKNVPVGKTQSRPGLEEPEPDVLEVWFAGTHSDIGGGNVENDVQVSLAQVTLHWMVEQVIQSQCGILFDSNELANIGFTKPSTSQGLPTAPNQPPSGSEAYPEYLDAIAPIFDDLKRHKLWWLLEFLPCPDVWQDLKGKWHNKWSFNFGKGRTVPYDKPKFHHTVKQRMECKSLKYKPRATYHNEVYV